MEDPLPQRPVVWIIDIVGPVPVPDRGTRLGYGG